MAGQRAEVEWKNGVPVSRRFDDPYYSLDDGLAEARYVFLGGNDLPARLAPGFHVAELGVGTGLNLLALVEAARAAGVRGLRYTGFEAFPLAPADLSAALAPFPVAPSDAAGLAEAIATGDTWRTDVIEATFVLGDARDTLPGWTGRADAWFLDGFAPARNPELWDPDLLREVARHTAPGGTAATYSAAGGVRRALAEAGFDVTRHPGFGRKRHMTRARLT